MHFLPADTGKHRAGILKPASTVVRTRRTLDNACTWSEGRDSRGRPVTGAGLAVDRCASQTGPCARLTDPRGATAETMHARWVDHFAGRDRRVPELQGPHPRGHPLADRHGEHRLAGVRASPRSPPGGSRASRARSARACASDLRRELRLNDLVIAVDGRPLDAILQPGSLYAGVGQPGERTYWAQIGAGAGSEIVLTVVRDGVEAVVSGRLGTDWFHYDAEGRPGASPAAASSASSEGRQLDHLPDPLLPDLGRTVASAGSPRDG